jgi:hypothetical protein
VDNLLIFTNPPCPQNGRIFIFHKKSAYICPVRLMLKNRYLVHKRQKAVSGHFTASEGLWALIKLFTSFIIRKYFIRTMG